MAGRGAASRLIRGGESSVAIDCRQASWHVVRVNPCPNTRARAALRMNTFSPILCRSAQCLIFMIRPFFLNRRPIIIRRISSASSSAQLSSPDYIGRCGMTAC
jgi:hypothetical protein